MSETHDSSGPTEKNKQYVAASADLKPGERRLVLVEGREIAVFNVDGEFYAVGNYCPHQGGPICEGKQSGLFVMDDDEEWSYEREDGIIACPWHGWEFDIPTGECVTGSPYCVPTYAVEVDDGDLYVIY